MILESDMAEFEDRGLDEISVYRAALQAIVDRSHNDPLGTSKVIDMRRIAETALTYREAKAEHAPIY